MTQVHIKWETGQMTINCENFFPAPQNKLKQLLKVIELDREHEDEILNKIMQTLRSLEKEYYNLSQEIKIQYQKEHQLMCELEYMVTDVKHPNGVPLTKVELKQAKGDLKEQKKLVRELEQDFKTYQKKKQKCRVNQEIMIDMKDGSWL